MQRWWGRGWAWWRCHRGCGPSSESHYNSRWALEFLTFLLRCKYPFNFCLCFFLKIASIFIHTESYHSYHVKWLKVKYLVRYGFEQEWRAHFATIIETVFSLKNIYIFLNEMFDAFLETLIKIWKITLKNYLYYFQT